MKEICGLTALTALALLSGCNSGGGDKGTPVSDASPTSGGASVSTSKVGVFLDAPVQGLKVVHADGSSATTGRWGEFSFTAGETLTFYLGGLRLGAVQGKAEITPLDLYSASNSNDRRVVNLLRLLQSLDSNDNPDDGIQLSAAAIAAGEMAALKLDQDTTLFEKDATLATLLAKKRPGLTLVGLAAAQAHFDATRSAAGKVGWWSGTLTFKSQQYPVQGLSGVMSDFSGAYKAANGKSYTVLVNATGNSAQIGVTTYTTLANGAFLPDIQNDTGSLQQSTSNWVFNGSGGTRLEISKVSPAANIGTIGYYGATSADSANVCPNGSFTLRVSDGYGIAPVMYLGMAYLDASGLRYAIKPLVSIGSDTIYSGSLSVGSDAIQLGLPGAKLTISRTNVAGLGLPACN